MCRCPGCMARPGMSSRDGRGRERRRTTELGRSQEPEGSVMGMTWRLGTASFLAVLSLLAATRALSAADDQPVSGVFKGNGKEAKLAYASARKGEPFADKPTTVLTFTEK